jgi:hypothetical protein
MFAVPVANFSGSAEASTAETIKEELQDNINIV